MKKQASPVPTPRAAALSQSASRYAAEAASAWQNIAGNSSRLVDANRRANGPSYAPLASRQAIPLEDIQRRLSVPTRTTLAPGQQPEPGETTRQVGWREVERAVSVSTKRKYSLFGIGFGPKTSVFQTEKVTVPVYQETDRYKRYYAAIKLENVAKIRSNGFEASFRNSTAAPQSVKQFNTHGSICFFSNESSARSYSKATIDGDCAIVEFVMPEYQEFTPDVEAYCETTKLNRMQAMHMTQRIPAECIKNIMTYL